MVGLLLGLGAAFLIDHLDDSVRNADDLARLGSDVALLGTIPNVSLRDSRPLSVSAPDDPAVESYRNLRTNVQFLGIERKVRLIQITSTRPGEGKTTTAANLAVVLSQAGSNVVLVDADLRKPDLHKMFAIDGSNGLTNNLAGDPMELTIQRINDQLWVIVGGPVPPNPSELLSGRRMEAFADELARRFDYVIIDSAPILAVSDAAALSRHVDGVLLVAQSKRVSLPELRQSLAALDRAGAPVLGIVLTRAKLDNQRLRRVRVPATRHQEAAAVASTGWTPPTCSSCATGNRSGTRSGDGRVTPTRRCRSSAAGRPTSPRRRSARSTGSSPATSNARPRQRRSSPSNSASGR